jgi:hypothetical protein
MPGSLPAIAPRVRVFDMMKLMDRQLKIKVLVFKIFTSLSPQKTMSEMIVTLSVLVVACLSLLAMSLRNVEQAGAHEPNCQTISPSVVDSSVQEFPADSPALISDLPPDDDKGAPGRRGGNRGQRGNMG